MINKRTWKNLWIQNLDKKIIKENKAINKLKKNGYRIEGWDNSKDVVIAKISNERRKFYHFSSYQEAVTNLLNK